MQRCDTKNFCSLLKISLRTLSLDSSVVKARETLATKTNFPAFILYLTVTVGIPCLFCFTCDPLLRLAEDLAHKVSYEMGREETRTL